MEKNGEHTNASPDIQQEKKKCCKSCGCGIQKQATTPENGYTAGSGMKGIVEAALNKIHNDAKEMFRVNDTGQ